MHDAHFFVHFPSTGDMCKRFQSKSARQLEEKCPKINGIGEMAVKNESTFAQKFVYYAHFFVHLFGGSLWLTRMEFGADTIFFATGPH